MTHPDVQNNFQGMFCFVDYVKQPEICMMSSELKQLERTKQSRNENWKSFKYN